MRSLRFTSALVLCLSRVALAHPLGNFTINHFTRIEVGAEQLSLRYVVDMAEIPTFQVLQAVAGNEVPSAAALDAYRDRMARQYADGILLTIDGSRVSLRPVAQRLTKPVGAGGLQTLRVELDLTGGVPPATVIGTRRLRFNDTNDGDRIGWHEIVVAAESGMSLFDSSVFGSAVTDELKAYPQDLLSTPLDERTAEVSFTRGPQPPGATPLRTRDGHVATAPRDHFVDLIAVPVLTPVIMAVALLIATLLGGLHALSPGHGKTVVGAYLVGARGTARHAAFLGLTVTITHTLGVFALGMITLFASQYVVPERLFPVLSVVSGALVLAMGLSLFVARLRHAVGAPAHHHHAGLEQADDQHHHHGESHSHLPPGADGSAITWRSLLALGISGGILPCPSALVVLLSAVALHRIGFGLLLIVAFSAGLASVLTAVGLAFVYASRFLKRPTGAGVLVRFLPLVSALVITVAGAAICHEALTQAGVNVAALFSTSGPPPTWFTAASVLGLGLVFGLKHALDADHLAAVSTIVSESKSLLSSSLVGAVWGIGHTLSLLVAGVAVILLHIEIGERTALALEFCVAIMLIGLGANALRKLARGGRVHLHAHTHDGHAHLHPHLHDGAPEPSADTHHGVRLSMRPLLVGMVHGLAGSAALMLLVLSTIPSPLLGLAYIGVFGIGSIGGMLFMSALVALPARLTAQRFSRAHLAVRTLASVFSLGFGLFMAYEIGVVGGLLL